MTSEKFKCLRLKCLLASLTASKTTLDSPASPSLGINTERSCTVKETSLEHSMANLLRLPQVLESPSEIRDLLVCRRVSVSFAELFDDLPGTQAGHPQ